MIDNMYLSEMMGGHIQKKFEKALHSVLQNLADKDIPSDPKRKITIEMKFEEDEDRREVSVEVEVKTKLVPQTTTRSRFWIEEDGDDIRIEELTTDIKGQLFINAETGEVME